MKFFIYQLPAFLLFSILTIEKTFAIDLSTFKKIITPPSNLPSGRGELQVGKDDVITKILKIMDFLIQIILYAAGSIAVFMVVLGGIMYVVSLGDETRTETAKKILTYAGLGLLAVIFSYAITTNVIDLILRATV